MAQCYLYLRPGVWLQHIVYFLPASMRRGKSCASVHSFCAHVATSFLMIRSLELMCITGNNRALPFSPLHEVRFDRDKELLFVINV